MNIANGYPYPTTVSSPGIPVLLPNGFWCRLSPQEIQELRQTCNWIDSNFVQTQILERGFIELTDCDFEQLHAAYQILKERKITANAFIEGSLAVIRLVKNFFPKPEVVFELDPQLFSTIEHVNLEHSPLELPVSLNLMGQRQDPRFFDWLPHFFPELKELSFSRTCSPQHFLFLPHLETLQELNLSGICLSSERTIPALPKLRELYLESCTITYFLPLAHSFRDLRKLTLNYCRVANLDFLERAYLEEIDLKSTQVDSNFNGQGYDVLSTMRGLRKVDLTDSNFSRLEALLSHRDTLEELELVRCERVEDFAPLQHLHNLLSLNVACTNFSDASVLPRGLKKLDLYKSALQDLTALSTLRELEELDISLEYRPRPSYSFFFSEDTNPITLNHPLLRQLVLDPVEAEETEALDSLARLITLNPILAVESQEII